jgi:hypothetical protein
MMEDTGRRESGYNIRGGAHQAGVGDAACGRRQQPAVEPAGDVHAALPDLGFGRIVVQKWRCRICLRIWYEVDEQ